MHISPVTKWRARPLRYTCGPDFLIWGCGIQGRRVYLAAFLISTLALGTLVGSPVATPVEAASSFANPAFQTQCSATGHSRTN
jgi:hypothetical protein